MNKLVITVVAAAVLSLFGGRVNSQKVASIPLINSARFQEEVEARKGHIIVLHIWRACCPECRSIFTALPRLNTDSKKSGVEIISVLIDVPKYRTTAANCIRQNHGSIPTWRKNIDDDDDFANTVSADWNGMLPFTQIYGSDGSIFRTISGVHSVAQIKAAIEACKKEDAARIRGQVRVSRPIATTILTV